ncbi:MAG: capsular polysaccharide biosynthesis protein [Firmicutes bacterium]|nr:capsular polysaccharide biosynthesis protein [Bacillota bacterium]MBQ9060297.1 capsular polysaccharide biosynthesis protein [Bacillota bacterium]
MSQIPEINTNETERDEIEIDLLDLFYYYRSKIKWIIAAFIVGALLAGLCTQFLITPKYTATSTMYMVSSSSGSVVDLTDLNIGESLSQDYIELIKTRPIIDSVIRMENLDYDYEELLNMLSLTVVSDTRIIKIAVTSPDPEEAMRIANDLAVKAEETLPNLMDAPKPNIAEDAILPTEKSSPSLTKNVMIGALLMLLLTLAILTIMYLMDDTLQSAEDVEKHFGIMPLTVIPEGKIEGLQSAESDKAYRSRRFGKGRKKNGKKYV